MSELVEGARLEIVCAVKSGTEGSNPSLSAKLPSLEVVSKPQVRLKGKAQADEKAKGKCLKCAKVRSV